ncbi:MAG: AmmeMemoRadiSam system radical SAM enzyme [Candidatus Jacksonbacteria bacterium]
MQKAILYEQLNNDLVKCTACAHYCYIKPENTGVCGVRKNIAGELFLLVYDRPIAVNIDPIEKKPLFHFLPGTQIFSLGTVGCNFGCDFCQNWDISQISKGQQSINPEQFGQDWPAKKIINYCVENQIPSIAYTYNEPTIFAEYAYDVMRLGAKRGIKNVFVSNGYSSAETYKLITPYLDAINIDLKSFNPDYYQKVCKAKLKPVLENIKKIFDLAVWLEVTTLIIPGQNDSELELGQIAEFLAKIDVNIPWHISRFFPQYKMNDAPPTPISTLEHAYKIGKAAGLHYVYVGNYPSQDLESTYCPKCGEIVIERSGYSVSLLQIKDGKCAHCGSGIRGVWE